MVRGTSTMRVAGPTLVKAAIGEDLDKEALGSAELQATAMASPISPSTTIGSCSTRSAGS
jgi:acetyl-CoA carboxylase carboxyltransferase component